MKKLSRRALGIASALFLVGAMTFAASPLQASEVDAKIADLERQIAELKQRQETVDEERALAAEMKMPSFKYGAGKGLTIAAADNNWSINFTQRLQLFSTFYLTEDNDEEGYQQGQIRIRRFRPSINVTSQQGFYEVKWTFNGGGSQDAAFDGDGYLHFEKMNPYLPTVGFGFNPSIKGLSEGAYRVEDSILADNLGFAGGQDRSLVLAWNKLPNMGAAKVAFLNFAIGHDEMDEYGKHPDVSDNSRSMLFTLGLRPLGASKSMGGIDMSSLQYDFAYEGLSNGYNEGAAVLKTTNATKQVELANLGKAVGDHTFVGHGLQWSPLKPVSLAAHFIDWKADADSGVTADLKATEWRVALNVWLWGPKSGMMGGSKSEGGISTSPMYSVIDLKDTGVDDEGADKGIGEVKNLGWAVVYHVPGGWMQIHGIWDRYECDPLVCADNVEDVSENGKSFSTFTLVAEYRF